MNTNKADFEKRSITRDKEENFLIMNGRFIKMTNNPTRCLYLGLPRQLRIFPSG